MNIPLNLKAVSAAIVLICHPLDIGAYSLLLQHLLGTDRIGYGAQPDYLVAHSCSPLIQICRPVFAGIAFCNGIPAFGDRAAHPCGAAAARSQYRNSTDSLRNCDKTGVPGQKGTVHDLLFYSMRGGGIWCQSAAVRIRTQWAAMPSPAPVNPRFSSVVAFTLTWEMGTPKASAKCSRIAGI